MMFTYVIKSSNLYKIGRTINVEKRISSLSTGNADIQLIKSYKGNFEKELHNKFKEKRVKGEWFNLNEKDLQEIETISLGVNYTISDKKIKEKETPFGNTVIFRDTINIMFLLRVESRIDFKENLRKVYYNNKCIGIILINNNRVEVVSCIPDIIEDSKILLIKIIENIGRYKLIEAKKGILLQELLDF